MGDYRYVHAAVSLLVLAVLGLSAGCTPPGLPGDNQRAAIQSQCAQNIIVCTTSFPDPIIEIEAGPGQQVTATARGFLVVGSDGDGSEVVNLIGSNSDPGDGANELFYSWSQGATDTNPRSLTPGPEFSSEPDPSIQLQAGFHYIRLTLRNDNVRDIVDADTGDIIDTRATSDFLEIEVEIRD